MNRLASTSRRDFLRGRGMREAIGKHVKALGATESVVPAVGRAGDWLLTVGRRAMACQFQFLVPSRTPDAVAAGSAALDEVDRLETQLTVYRDDSELSRINALASVLAVPVEERLFGLLEAALELSAQTAGAFDIAVGALVKCWGFFRGPKRVPEGPELAAVMERVGSRHVRLDSVHRTVQFDRPGVEFNLGAIGKGYALDRAAAMVRDDWGVEAAILHGGRSSVYAIGTSPDAEDEEGWVVGIQHPFDPSRRVARLRLRDKGLGTSGATIQYFEVDGRRFGHILDPRTGWPAHGQACVSVIAPTAAQADALSTAFFILGPDLAGDYCRRHPEIGAVLVSTAEQGGPLRVQVVGAAEGIVAVDS